MTSKSERCLTKGDRGRFIQKFEEFARGGEKETKVMQSEYTFIFEILLF